MARLDGPPHTASKVSGFDVAPGSAIKPDGRDYQVQTAEEITVSGVVVPAGSWFEPNKANSIVTGDRYNWNGVVHFGGPHAYGLIEGQKGDRGFFTGSLFSNAQLTQIAIPHRGRWRADAPRRQHRRPPGRRTD